MHSQVLTNIQPSNSQCTSGLHSNIPSCLLWLLGLCLCCVLLSGLRFTLQARRASKFSLWFPFGQCHQDEYSFGNAFPLMNRLFTDLADYLSFFLWEAISIEFLVPTVIGMWGLPRAAQWTHAFLSSARTHRHTLWDRLNSCDPRYVAPRFIDRPPGEWRFGHQWHHHGPEYPYPDLHHPWHVERYRFQAPNLHSFPYQQYQ